MCGGGTPSYEQQAQQMDTAPEISYGRAGSRPQPGFQPPIPLEVLNGIGGAKQLPNNPGNVVQLENLSQYTIGEAYNRIVHADVGMAGFEATMWAQIKRTIDDATNSFQQQLNALEQSATVGDPQSWTGAAHDTAIQNLFSSYQTIETISNSVGTLHGQVQTFANTIQNTQDAIVPQYFTYQSLMNNPQQPHKDVITYAFDKYAQSVLTTTYAPPIVHVANTAPPFPTATPQVGSPAIPAAPGPGGVPGGGLGGLRPVGGGGGALGPVSGPPPNVTNPTPPQNTSQTPTTPQTPTNPSAAAGSPASSGTSGLGQLGDSAAQGAQGLTSGLGQAANGAQRGNTGAPPGGPNGPGKLPPEGALAKGLKGGGAGGGAGARGLPIGKAGGAPATAAGATRAAGGPNARLSGVGGAGAGAPVAGAPGGGQAGNAGQGAQHQPSKALRRKQNGEELIGDAVAVVPVLGEPARAEAAQPGVP